MANNNKHAHQAYKSTHTLSGPAAPSITRPLPAAATGAEVPNTPAVQQDSRPSCSLEQLLGISEANL